MTTTLIDLQVQSGIATLTFNRPDKRNAMSDDMRTEFIHALEHVAADKAIRALVLTGAGRGFCAGGDISGMERRMKAPAGEVGLIEPAGLMWSVVTESPKMPRMRAPLMPAGLPGCMPNPAKNGGSAM